MARVSQQIVKLLVSPFLYLICLAPVTAGIFIATSSMEYGGFLYRYVEPLYWYDYAISGVDAVALATILVIVGLAFGTLSRLLISLEGLAQPKLIDHIRRCAYLYVLFVMLSAVQIPEYVKSYRLPGYPGPEFLGQVLWLVVGGAILVDAIMLVLWRRRCLTISRITP